MKINFNDLPSAVGLLFDRLDQIENLITVKSIQGEHSLNTFLSLEETSNFLCLAKTTIYGLVHRKVIPYCKVGKKLYFEKDDLIKWIKSGKSKTKKEITEDVENYFESKKGGLKNG